MTKSGTTVSFGYDHNGLRTSKTVNGTVTNYTLHGKNIVHLTHGSSDWMHFFYDASGKVASVNYNGQRYAYLYNMQGDVVGLLDSTGAEVVKYTYDAWGRQLSKTGTLASTLGTLNPFRYRGYVYDEETELYYLRSRYYNPTWGRFVNADVVIDAPASFSNNAYCYCSNKSTCHIDSDGDIAQGAMHEAVCTQIVLNSNGELHKTGVMLIWDDRSGFGRADIVSNDGMIWEVKRVTCSTKAAFSQLTGYLKGKFTGKKSRFPGLTPTRGDNRPIFGIVLSVPGYIGYYANVGNGFILYDYIKLPEKEHSTENVVEQLEARVEKKAESYRKIVVVCGLSAAMLFAAMQLGGGSGGWDATNYALGY